MSCKQRAYSRSQSVSNPNIAVSENNTGPEPESGTVRDISSQCMVYTFADSMVKEAGHIVV